MTFPVVWPVRELTSQLFPPVWRYLGRLGLAARQVLRVVLWPIVWPFAFLFKVLQRGWQASKQYVRDRWAAGAPERTHRKRRWRSWWLVQKSRWRVRLAWRKPPVGVVVAPAVPAEPSEMGGWWTRPRLVTAFVLTNALVFIGGILVYQTFFAPLPNEPTAVADNQPATVTPTPTITVTPPPPFTPTPRPRPPN
ncbi:MAG: hypothetical protein KDD89_11490 [Anaerolineales bacterium]|nr:hypothetical protein [Anaerolineales bacterium]